MHDRLFACLLAVALAGTAACKPDAVAGGEDETSESPSATRVETLRLEAQRFEDIIELTGSVEAINDATLSAQTAGRVASLAERGDVVGKGATVARLDASQARVAVQQAQAQVAAAESRHELAEDTYQRMEPLFRDSIISPQEFERVRTDRSQAQANLNQAKAALAQAREGLADTSVTSPFAGTIEDRFVDPGEQVAPGEPMLRVVDLRRVKVTAGVPERHANHIELGTTVDLGFRASPGPTQTAEVTFVGGVIDPDTRTFPIEVELENASRKIKPQMVVQLHVTRDVIEEALLVPRAAVVRDEIGTSVYTVAKRGADTVAERREVTLGSGSGERVLVRSGLSAGDRVIVAGANDVSDSALVEVVGESGVQVEAAAGRGAAATEPSAPQQHFDSGLPR